MTKTNDTNTEWIVAAMDAIPDELSADEVASFLITITVTRLGLRKALITLMSLPLTLSRTMGISYADTAKMYELTAKDIAERVEH